MRRAVAVIATALLLAALTGCATACPAIGWINNLTVNAGAVDGVEDLQFCIDDECSPRTSEASPTGSASTMFQADRDRDEWTLRLDMNAPETVVIRLFGADGELLQESEHTIVWTPPTGQCGGASTAPPIILEP
jgi:hypothetical protein